MLIGEHGYGAQQWRAWDTSDIHVPRSSVYRAFNHQSLLGVGMGMGELSQEMGQLLATAPSAGFGVAAPLLVAAGVIAKGSIFIPIIGAAVAGVTMALLLIFARKGPKQKVATTKIVDKVEPLLQQNLEGYMSGPRTESSRAAALANYDAGWQYVVEYCDTPSMGAPGKACVVDRQPGGRWPWASYYRDPIANDKGIVPDPVVNASGVLVTTQVDPATGQQVTVPFTGAGMGIGIDSGILILGGAALLLVMAMQSGGGSGEGN